MSVHATFNEIPYGGSIGCKRDDMLHRRLFENQTMQYLSNDELTICVVAGNLIVLVYTFNDGMGNTAGLIVIMQRGMRICGKESPIAPEILRRHITRRCLCLSVNALHDVPMVQREKSRPQGRCCKTFYCAAYFLSTPASGVINHCCSRLPAFSVQYTPRYKF